MVNDQSLEDTELELTEKEFDELKNNIYQKGGEGSGNLTKNQYYDERAKEELRKKKKNKIDLIL